MKKYIDAQLQVVRISNNDVIVTSIQATISGTTDTYLAPGIRDFEDYSH